MGRSLCSFVLLLPLALVVGIFPSRLLLFLCSPIHALWRHSECLFSPVSLPSDGELCVGLTVVVCRVVGWECLAGIHHKTSLSPGNMYGYPDEGYLDRVEDELKCRGVFLDDEEQEDQFQGCHMGAEHEGGHEQQQQQQQKEDEDEGEKEFKELLADSLMLGDNAISIPHLADVPLPRLGSESSFSEVDGGSRFDALQSISSWSSSLLHDSQLTPGNSGHSRVPLFFLDPDLVPKGNLVCPLEGLDW